MKNKNKYIILCPTFKRFLYKIGGGILFILWGISYVMFPKFFEDKEAISLFLTTAITWMLTRAGFKKVGRDDE